MDIGEMMKDIKNIQGEKSTKPMNEQIKITKNGNCNIIDMSEYMKGRPELFKKCFTSGIHLRFEEIEKDDNEKLAKIIQSITTTDKNGNKTQYNSDQAKKMLKNSKK
jgi:hypothetical protein